MHSYTPTAKRPLGFKIEPSGLNWQKLEMAKHDRARASYYNYYTENRWGEAKNYDLCLNATLGREACADLIVAAARAMQEADK